MTDARWATFVDQLLQMDVIDQRFAPTDLYTNSYLPELATPDLAELPALPAGSYLGQG